MKGKTLSLIFSGFGGFGVGAASGYSYHYYSINTEPNTDAMLTAIMAILWGISVGYSFAYTTYHQIYNGGEAFE